MQIQALRSAPISALQTQTVRPLAPQPLAPSQAAPQDQLKQSAKTGSIPALAAVFSKAEPELPPIEVVQRENYTYSRNAFGVQITHVKMEEGNYYYLLSDQGLAIMLRQHEGKRDTLNFTDMNFNIPSPGKFPNVFFHIQGEKPSQISFTPEHHVRVDLPNGDFAIFDRENGQVLKEGPFQIQFFPDEAGEHFNVGYTGQDSSVKRFTSKGDHVQW
ncbi:hypothetical protein COW36_04855 [bacterium (Candidatus Blackallbacteria) CG17_big_fil_post_rev_8_21_14_2_50_48_46]|uniref:Uncharacterized protein n=1 Tax=bacterium (Candidatus Blackallbacteria) CG17_big_fil_post_rev_8_21_14_2_50_48_46 TaxID=2014261 RepID=A0A2M7G953_9BACT|nr:MAG: hypothetical protein COW64_04090 [bacterium (Candidatus Blackallbacteria) CG18_big_fil_WC_8_21_14_2_50_49_26]PIW18625.1 MAG: hypothetical protein COW36_04855 [bacterium (Candidatus Blackallbacteria) CG17_big_fil_post_rev_8_21_14_2_50_48_46]PIW46389.1 MAG: hypothetical protein COW20_15825 [bacterium (Candidatus Blackallbacteria) CG13_big_fil_rev_8_21_14_2_50_49_14]